MRIDQIHIDGFGRLERFDAGPALGRLVVVLGPNEAGKSTLFNFLTTALYGFQPASRELSPHVPWGSDEAAGRISLRLDGDGCAEVERRLRSQPTTRLTVDGRATELRNQPLPWVEHVPRTVFRQVFAVTLGDLAGLDGDTWARIQDRVVGSMGATDLRSAREVAEELEREASELWRPNRRGNQRLRDLQADVRALRGRRNAAQERDRRVRDLVEERDRVRDRLNDVRERRQRDRTEIERAQTLLPVKRQLDRIEALRAQGGNRGALEGLPDDPPAQLAELESEQARLAERRSLLTAELAERDATIEQFDGPARRLVERRQDVARLIARSAACASDRARATELRAEIQDIEERLDVTSHEVLDRSWREVSAEALATVPVAVLRERIASRAAGTGRATAVRTGPLASLLAVASGAALLVWGLTSGPVAIAVAGAGLAGGGLATWLLGRRDRGAPGARASARSDVMALLSKLPVRREHLARPGEALVVPLERLQALLFEREQRARALEGAVARVSAVDAEARAVARQLERDEHEDAEIACQVLDRDLEAAERLREAARLGRLEAGRFRIELEALDARSEALRPALERLRAAGSALGQGDVSRGLADARGRLAAHRRADQLEDELETVHPDLDDTKKRLASAPTGGSVGTVDLDDLAAAQGRVERCESEIEDLLKRGEALQAEADHLRGLETVDAIDGETESLRQEEARLVRRRDRKWVVAQLLREADRRFREEHQPDLIRRAGSYLEHLTGGRYQRLIVDDTGAGDLFSLVGPGLPVPVPLAPPVSTGTLEQAYLSLRLAIVDHLDQGGERLPLFVDEVFVNWDRERRARGLEVLASVSAARQVFVFTCHPAVADDLRQRGASVLRLDPAA